MLKITCDGQYILMNTHYNNMRNRNLFDKYYGTLYLSTDLLNYPNLEMRYLKNTYDDPELFQINLEASRIAPEMALNQSIPVLRCSVYIYSKNHIFNDDDIETLKLTFEALYETRIEELSSIIL